MVGWERFFVFVIYLEMSKMRAAQIYDAEPQELELCILAMLTSVTNATVAPVGTRV